MSVRFVHCINGEVTPCVYWHIYENYDEHNNIYETVVNEMPFLMCSNIIFVEGFMLFP
jgi:hypothetical protein